MKKSRTVQELFWRAVLWLLPPQRQFWMLCHGKKIGINKELVKVTINKSNFKGPYQEIRFYLILSPIGAAPNLSQSEALSFLLASK